MSNNTIILNGAGKLVAICLFEDAWKYIRPGYLQLRQVDSIGAKHTNPIPNIVTCCVLSKGKVLKDIITHFNSPNVTYAEMSKENRDYFVESSFPITERYYRVLDKKSARERLTTKLISMPDDEFKDNYMVSDKDGNYIRPYFKGEIHEYFKPGDTVTEITLVVCQKLKILYADIPEREKIPLTLVKLTPEGRYDIAASRTMEVYMNIECEQYMKEKNPVIYPNKYMYKIISDWDRQRGDYLKHISKECVHGGKRGEHIYKSAEIISGFPPESLDLGKKTRPIGDNIESAEELLKIYNLQNMGRIDLDDEAITHLVKCSESQNYRKETLKNNPEETNPPEDEYPTFHPIQVWLELNHPDPGKRICTSLYVIADLVSECVDDMCVLVEYDPEYVDKKIREFCLGRIVESRGIEYLTY